MTNLGLNLAGRGKTPFGRVALTFLAGFLGCGSNVDEFPFPDAGPQPDAPPLVEGGVDAEDPEEPDAPPSACPVVSPIRLTTALGDSSQPAILWNGAQYVVVWADGRAGVGMGDIYGAILSAEGAVVAPERVLVDTPNLATSPEIAIQPAPLQGYALVYEDCMGSTELGCTQGAVGSVNLGPDLTPTGAPQMLTGPAPVQRRPYLAAGHGNVYVTYRDQIPAAVGSPAKTVARLAPLAPTGALLNEGVLIDQASDGHYPHVAVGPTQVALAYQRNKPTPEIVLALFDPMLTLLKELPVRTGLPQEATNPVVQWNTSRWVLAWEDERDGLAVIYASVAAADGSSADPPQKAYPENGNWPAIASGGKNTSLIGFYGFPGERVFLARMQENGQLKPGQVVIGVGKFPSVAYNPAADEYGVAYQDDKEDEIMFARFKCAD